MASVAQKIPPVAPTKELVSFLKAQGQEVCAAWLTEVQRQPDLAALYPTDAARTELAADLKAFYEAVIAHLERPDTPPGGDALESLVRRYYEKGISPTDISRLQILLKRLVIRRLVAQYPDQRDVLGEMCALYEEEIDQTRMRASSLRHEIEIARMRDTETRLRIFTAVTRMTNAVISASSTDATAHIVFANLRDVIRYELVAVGLITADRKQVECSCVWGSGASVNFQDMESAGRLLLASCVRRNASILLGDVSADPNFKDDPLLTQHKVLSCVAAPLAARGQVVGAILLGSPEKNAYSTNDQQVLVNIATEISLAIQNQRLLATERKRTAELEMINAIGNIVTEHLDTKGLLKAAAQAIQKTFAYYDVSFFLVDSKTNSVVMAAQAGAFGELMDLGYRQPIGVGMVGWAAQHGQTLIANDVSKEPRRIIAFPGEADCKSEMVVPIKVGDTVVGVINVESRELHAFDERDQIALETIARQIARGIENANLFNQTRILKELSEDIVSAIPLTLLVLDRDLRVVSFNPASLSNLGLSESALRGRHLQDLLSGDVASSSFYASICQAVREGRLISLTGISVELANLGRRVFNVWYSPTQAHTDGVGLLILQDITQQSLTEEEMRRTRRHLQLLMTHLPIGITTTDLNGVYTLWSSGCERMFGYRAEEMVGKETPLRLAKVPYDLAAELEQCRQQGYNETERINVRKDGTEIWVHKVRVNLYDEAGKHIGYVSYLQDITQRRKVQEELLREKQKLSEIVGALGAGVALMDLDHKITWANKTLHDWFGDGHTVIGRNCFEVFHRQGSQCDQCLSTQVAATGQVQKHIHSLWMPGGALRHFQHIVAPIRDRGSQVSQLLCMTLDVTEHVERVKQLSMLQQLGEQLQGVLELDRLLYLILTCVTAGEGLGFNRAVLLLADRERGVLEGRMGVGPTSAEEAGRIWRQISEEKKQLKDFLDQYDHMRPADQEAMMATARPMRFSLTETNELPVACLLKKEAIVIHDAWRDERVSPRCRQLIGADQFVVVPLVARGQAIGVLVADNRFSRHPITDNLMQLVTTFANHAALAIAAAEAYHRLEEKIQQLAETQDRLVRSERLAAIGTMAAHVAHEIRNPLVTIGGFARAISRQADPSTPCGQHSRIIVEEVARLEKILANVMNFTKPATPRRSNVNLEQVLDNTCLLFADAFKARNVALIKDYRLGSETAFVDPAQMKQVFVNLLQNALDSIEAPSGQVTVRTSAEGNRFRIEVADNGVGIPPNVQENIFLPFFTTKPDGTGLGLAVSRKIVEEHGGELTMKSAVGVGTTFTILLPRNPTV